MNTLQDSLTTERVQSETLLHVFSGGRVSMPVWDHTYPLLASLIKAAQECEDGSFKIALSKPDGTAYYAVGDTLVNAINNAAAMIANGAHLDA